MVVCNAVVASTEYKTSKDGKTDEKTTWHKISVWGKQAKWAAQNLKKGDTVLVDGKIHYSDWIDKDNNKRKSISIAANSIQTILNNKMENKQSRSSESYSY
jgi:single-strand DNA-binding protein